MKKIFLIMVCMIFLIGTVSALDIDNKVTYSDKDLKVTIENAFGLPFFGDEIGTLELKSHNSVNEVKEVGQGDQVVMYYDFNYKELYENGLGNVEFIDMNTDKSIERDYSFVYWGTEEKEVPTYFCDENIILENGFKKCIQNGTKIVMKEKWIPYDSKDIPKGDIRIGLQTYVEFGDYIDGVWTISGKEIKKHAAWTESLNTNLISYYKFDGGSGTVANDSHGPYNLEGLNTPGWTTSGRINNATSLASGSSEYWQNSSTGSSLYTDVPFSINAWAIVDSQTNLLTLIHKNANGDSGEQGKYLLRYTTDTNSWQYISYASGGGGLSILGNITVSAGNWYMVSLVADGTNSKLFINGVIAGHVAQEDTFDSSEGSFWIGRAQNERYLDGDVDEVSIWNRSLTDGEITQLYNGGSGIQYTNEFGLGVTLLTHVNNTNFTTNALNFTANVSDPALIGITNVSLYINDTIFETNTSTFEGNYSFDFTSPDGTFNYTIRAWGDDNVLYNASNGTLTFNVDTINPLLNLTAPSGTLTLGELTANETLLWNVSDVNLDDCFYDYNFTNVTVNCALNTTKFALTNQKNITFWANDTFGRIVSNVSTWDYLAFVNSQTFNVSSYETASETFYLNITTDGSVPTNGKLVYNGTTHDATITNVAGNVYNIFKTIDIPNINQTKSFNFAVTLGGSESSTAEQTQLINKTELGLCNASLIEPYVNFSFKDEADDSYINATIDSSTWDYWLGDGSVSKELLYTNNTENFNYTFCFKGGNRTMKNNRSIQYASTGYPQRKYDSTSDLTNTTTETILYLLSSSDGIYSTIQVVDAQGDKVSGVSVIAERQFSGVWTIIGQETTDDAGAVTFWLNPDYDHKFTFTSNDCVGETATIRPTQTQYTQQLQCDGVGTDFVSNLEGIRYAREPLEGIIQTGIQNFTYFITSSRYTIVNATFQVINASDEAILNFSTTTCNSDECIVYFIYDVQSGDNLKGRYYFDVGNGSILLEADAHWVNVGIDTAGKSGMGTFWKDMRYVIDEWGDDSATADFNRILIVFFFICISIAFLNFHTGIDTQNPGAFMFILTAVIVSGSLVGGVDGQGFFYYTNNLTGNNFLNNYILALFCIVITFSYLIRTNIQANR